MNSPAPISGDWHCGSNCQTYQSGTTGEALLLQPWSGYWAVLVGGWTNPSYLDPSYLEESACHCLSNWIIFSGFPGEKKHVWNTKNQLGPSNGSGWMNLFLAGLTFEGSGFLGKVSSSHLNDNKHSNKAKARTLALFSRAEKVMIDMYTQRESSSS